MHIVSKVSESAAKIPAGYENHSRGFRRSTYVHSGMGSVHMGVGVCYLEPNGAIDAHLHSFEESFYVLEGSLTAKLGESAHELRPGGFGLIRTGAAHGWKNAADKTARWLEMQSPQPRPVGTGPDTFFVEQGTPQSIAQQDTDSSRLGHFDESQLPSPGGKSQMEGFNPTTGVAIKMFVDRSFGAIHQSLFLIQYMPGAKIDPHDHTFEESYLIVDGSVRATADGQAYDLGPGDVIWTGVGCVHSFANIGATPVRWIETQAPLPPAKEIFRFERDWVLLTQHS
jgi:quercetin dioxygenase-like cupin family protein